MPRVSQQITLAFPAAIPVGHRVEVTWYPEPAGLLGRKQKPAPAHPVLVDLDTGVRYVTHWHVGRHAAFRSDRPNDYATAPLGDLVAERVLRGRVRACTVVHVSLSDPYQHTVLVLEEE